MDWDKESEIQRQLAEQADGVKPKARKSRKSLIDKATQDKPAGKPVKIKAISNENAEADLEIDEKGGRYRRLRYTWHLSGLKLSDTPTVKSSEETFSWVEDCMISVLKARDYISYNVVALEVCPTTGSLHLQGYFEFNTQVGFMALKDTFKGISLRCCWATAADNRIYCLKGDQSKAEYKLLRYKGPNYGKNVKFWEWGEPANQGARNDLREINKNVRKGKTVKEVRQEDPVLYHKYWRTMEKLEDDYISDECWQLNLQRSVLYLFGASGTGKSRFAHFYDSKGRFDHNKVYPWNKTESFQSYEGQPIILINELREDHIDYSYLLEITDVHPCGIKRKNRQDYPNRSQEIVITSPMPPEYIFRNGKNKYDTIYQFYRRARVYEVVNVNGEVQWIPHFYSPSMENTHGVNLTASVNQMIDMFH